MGDALDMVHDTEEGPGWSCHRQRRRAGGDAINTEEESGRNATNMKGQGLNNLTR